MKEVSQDLKKENNIKTKTQNKYLTQQNIKIKYQKNLIYTILEIKNLLIKNYKKK